MKIKKLFPLPVLLLISVSITLVIMASCATPVAPTGGEPDRTPPQIVSTSPANETVNFDGRRIEIEFSKFVDRGSFANAISIEPDLVINYDISWRRKTARIEFDRDLPDNTTIIINIGTDLQDTRNNRLATPYALALSTGPEIDDGKVTARILRAADGTTDTGYRVFLYREPFDLDERANYVGQTDTAGYVNFGYLAEDTYKAIWVDDQNRNRIWDRDREPAQPFFDSTFTLSQGEEYDLGAIFIDLPDTTRPSLQGVGLLTEEMLRLRFNEEIYWDDDAYIEVKDTLLNTFTRATPLYVLPEDPFILMAQTEDPLPEEQRFTLQLNGIYDEAGNRAQVRMDPFAGSSQPDTLGLRIIGDNIEPGLFRDEPLIVGYNKFIDDDNVLDSLRVVAGDEMIEDWENVEIDRHRLKIFPNDAWESGVTYQFLIWNPYREELRPLEPVIWQRNQLGSIEFSLADTTNQDEHFLTLYDNEGKVHIDTTFVQHLEIDNLPPLRYTAIVFRDQNQSGTWEPGTVIPFQAPEPYFVRKDVPVREGFTSELEVEFQSLDRSN